MVSPGDPRSPVFHRGNGPAVPDLLFFGPMRTSLVFGLILAVILASMAAKADLQPAAVPNPKAFLGWENNPDFPPSGAKPETFKRVTVDCPGRELFPTHPQQTTKTYHVSLLGRYDHFRLRAGDDACERGADRPNARGEMSCLRPDSIEYAVISDFYQDRCGNFYRGFWDVQFLKTNDTMGTLFSQGRVLFQNPKSPFENDMYVADTYALNESNFVFLAPVTENEVRIIKREKESALRTHRFDPETQLFILKKKP